MCTQNRRLYLRAFEYSDLEFVNKLRNNDALIALTCGNKYYISSERDRKWIDDKIFNNYNQLYLMLCRTKDNQPIGYICATNIDYVNRKARWDGILIEEEFSGNGYGTEGGQLLLEHLFCELGMNMVYGFLLESHLASLKMVKKIGFRVDGLVRNFVYKRNMFHNVYVITILKSEHDDIIRKVTLN